MNFTRENIATNVSNTCLYILLDYFCYFILKPFYCSSLFLEPEVVHILLYI